MLPVLIWGVKPGVRMICKTEESCYIVFRTMELSSRLSQKVIFDHVVVCYRLH